MQKKEEQKLDKLFIIAVKEWFGEKCAICGKEPTEIHHVVGRANRATRWYIPNGVPLCQIHHTLNNYSAHQNKPWFIKNIEAIRGSTFSKSLQIQANRTFKGTFEQVESYLKSNHPEVGY